MYGWLCPEMEDVMKRKWIGIAMGSFLMVLAGYASGNTQKDEKARKLEQLSLDAGHPV